MKNKMFNKNLKIKKPNYEKKQKTTEVTKYIDARTNKMHLHITASKSEFVPAYVYYILEYQECESVSFGTSDKLYLKESLKGKQDWKDVK